MRFLIVLLILLAGCQSVEVEGKVVTQTEEEIQVKKDPSFSHEEVHPEYIFWKDIVRVNGITYERATNQTLSSLRYLGRQVGEVLHKTQDVEGLSYEMKDGDAANLKEGTKLFAVIGEPDFIVANSYKGYLLYTNSNTLSFDLQDLVSEEIRKVELYQDEKLIRTISSREDVQTFVSLFHNGEEVTGYTRMDDTEKFDVVFYTDGAVAYERSVFRDPVAWYWRGDRMELLPDRMEEWFEEVS